MKYFFTLLIFCSFTVNAREMQTTSQTTTDYIQSSGRGTGFCDGGAQGWFCYDQIKARSKEDAVRSAYYTCSARRGQLQETSAYCTYFCSPFSIPQGGPTQYVQCSSSCTTACVISN